MKPKHRIFCPAAGKQKMVFESKKKALRFIQYNADQFEPDKIPKRTYYCSSCCGWHITSQEKRESRIVINRNAKIMKAKANKRDMVFEMAKAIAPTVYKDYLETDYLEKIKEKAAKDSVEVARLMVDEILLNGKTQND